MLNVLNTQLYRLKKSKLFWALFIVCAVLPLLGSMFITATIEIVGNIFAEDNNIIFDTIKDEGGLRTLSVLGGLITLGSDAALFSLICSSIFLSGEFSGGAIRNMVLANKSRTQIFLSFLSVSLIIGFSYFGVNYLSTILCYGVTMGFGGVTTNQILSGCFATLFLGLVSIALVQTCVCLFLFTTRKTGPTVAFPLIIMVIAPSLVTTIVEVVLSVKMLAGQQVSLSGMGWIPIFNMTLFDASEIDGALIGKIVLYNIPLAAIFGVLGWLASKKDMK